MFQHHSSVLENRRIVLLAGVMNTTILCSCSLEVICEGPGAAVNSTKGKAYLFPAMILDLRTGETTSVSIF